ncbi:GNAT family N-acetyltransferase [Amycolatopsis aidingensis]|uniref:GNAT family N-acetyltransferase n=1 Tax=Amycolatopsis aidingensis TaxID=2842453 RepID=UPI001E32FFC3|nr:GNAT family protein [Amycolatopsis aidingensis]
MINEPGEGPLDIEGERVRLREFAGTDAEALYGIIGDPRVAALLSFDAHTRAEVRELLDGIVERAGRRPRPDYTLAITSRADGQLVGFALLIPTGTSAAKLGYAVAYQHRGKGYTTDAIRALLNLGFGSLGLHRISASLGPDNTSSIALLERFGFVREGVLREHVYTGGAWRDSVLMALLEHEWNAT